MGITVKHGRKLKPAYFIATVESPLPFMSSLEVQMSKNYEGIAKMLAMAMEQENTIASVLIMAVAEYQIETNVDTLRLLNESITDLRKLKAATEAGTEGDNIDGQSMLEIIEKYFKEKKPNRV